ncbi:MAG: MarR family winged helix-turn-helix transcriptional regulator [Chloroflexi bacterium]|nr:MarR family winged helix-turn-helix transcriptional regulator [Chloroflexota bacterium]
MIVGEELLDGSSPEAVLLRVIRRAWSEISSTALRRLAAAGLTPQQLFVLDYLCHQKAQPSELARWHHVGMSSMSSLIDGLVARGLVERHQDPGDRRAVLLTPTTAGREMMREGVSVLLEGAHHLLSPLSSEQREQLVQALLQFEQSAAFGKNRRNDNDREGTPAAESRF